MNETGNRGNKQSRGKTTGCDKVLKIGFVDIRWVGQQGFVKGLIHGTARVLGKLHTRSIRHVNFHKSCEL